MTTTPTSQAGGRTGASQASGLCVHLPSIEHMFYPPRVRDLREDIHQFETEHESGYEGSGWRLLTPAALYEVEEADVRHEGQLRMWRLWPDGWYGLIRWGDNRRATWVHESRLRPIDANAPKDGD